MSSYCRPGSSLSLGSSGCVECSHWRQNLIGIVIAAFVGGIVLIIIVLALNMTTAVGTLNGILFYANTVSINADTYLPFSTPNVVTVFISWLNLDLGFDVCLFEGMDASDKAMIQIAFPAYVILLVTIVIVISEYSTKFAKLIGKGNPVAALATMILLSYAKFFAVIRSLHLPLYQFSYGPCFVDHFKGKHVFLIVFGVIIVVLLGYYSLHCSYFLLAVTSSLSTQAHFQLGKAPKVTPLY